MGVVYLATQLRPRRRVALKLIAPQYAADAAYRERFLREVDALAALEHPHIVPIHAAGEWEGQLYLAMRYLEGPDLAGLVRETGPLGIGRTVQLLAPVADALDAAHAAGIVHRDVTPANIRLDARGVPYLTDFGLTKRAASSGGLTLAGGPVGTPAYMAPEQFATGEAEPDPALATRIDVYALGCVVCTCLTGAPPYPRDTYEAALWAHVHEGPPRLTARRPELPAALDGVLATALAKDPASRYPTAGALIAAVAAAGAVVRPAAGIRGAGSTSRGAVVPGPRAPVPAGAVVPGPRAPSPVSPTDRTVPISLSGAAGPPAAAGSGTPEAPGRRPPAGAGPRPATPRPDARSAVTTGRARRPDRTSVVEVILFLVILVGTAALAIAIVGAFFGTASG